MKKYILAAAFPLALLFSPVATQAAGLTSSQIQAILSLLQSFGANSATIANVQAALGGTSGTGGTGTWCHTFLNDLTVATDKGAGDVSALKQALDASGIDPSGDSPSVFTENTASLVVQFQAKYGIKQTGYVGPITRAKLNQLYGCGNVQPAQPFITALSPSSGPVGTTVIISGSGFNPGDIVYFSGQPVSATSNAYSTTDGNITSWSFVVPSTSTQIQSPPCLPAVTGVMCEVRVARGAYIRRNGVGSNAGFHVTGGTVTTTSAPTVEFIGTPTLSLQTDSSGKEAYLVGRAKVAIMADDADVFFSGSVPMLLTNGQGQAYTNSTRIVVTSSSGTTTSGTAPSVIPVILAGTTATVTIDYSVPTSELFAGSYYLRPTDLAYYLNGNPNTYQSISASSFRNAQPSNTVTIVGETSPYITSAVSDASGTLTITGVRFAPSGNLLTWGGNISGESFPSSNNGTQIVVQNWIRGSTTLQVTNPSTGKSNIVYVIVNEKKPSITVLSPNGGETWTPGAMQTIKWQSSPAPAYDVSVFPYSDPRCPGNVCTLASSISETSYNWQVGWANMPGGLPNGTYKIRVCQIGTSVCDESDGYFQIENQQNATPVTLTNITPSSGPVGTSVRLDGCGSDSTSGFTLVYTGPKSGSAAIPVETLGAASGCGYMTITVPSDFPAGAYSLSVKNNQTGAMSTNGVTFTVTAPAVANNPVASVSPTSFVAGANFTSSITGAAPNTTIRVFSTGPDGVTSEDLPAGTTNVSGQFSRTHITTGWAAGTYRGWVTVNGVQSNVVAFNVTAPSTPITLTNITPASGPVGTSIRLDGCGSDSTSGFTLVYAGPKSGTANIPVETLGAASGCGYMTFSVPSDFPAGTYSLRVENNQTGAMSTNSMTFTVTAPAVVNNPVAFVSPTSFAAGSDFGASITGAAPNATIHVFSTGPDGVTSEDLPAGTTNASGQFSRTHNTTGWATGSYRGWVTVNGVQSNVVTFMVTAPPLIVSVSPTSFAAGVMATITVVNAAPNATLKVFCRDPNNQVCDDPATYGTNSSGQFAHTYNTTGWTIGAYRGWVTVNGVQSNSIAFAVVAPSLIGLSGGASQTAGVLNAVNGFASGNPVAETSAPAFTYVWNNNLQIGSPLAEDVKALQTALAQDGDYHGDLTGGFYNQTYAAVRAFQEKHGINATGFVGPLTRAELNTLFGR